MEKIRNRRTRRSYVCYPPNYQPGDGYVKCTSRYRMKKTLFKLGPGAEAVVNRTTADWDGSVMWGHGNEPDWIYNPENKDEADETPA